MIEGFFAMFRKRRRVDGESGTATTSDAVASQSDSPTQFATSRSNQMQTDDEYLSILNQFDSDLITLFNRQFVAQNISSSRKRSVFRSTKLESEEDLLDHPTTACVINAREEQLQRSLKRHGLAVVSHQGPSNCLATQSGEHRSLPQHCEDMEIDSAPVPPPKEYSDNPFQQQSHNESSMNFDYLSSLHTGAAGGGAYDSGGMDTSAATSSMYGKRIDVTGGHAFVDDRAVDRPFNLNERFVNVLDQLDARVEKFRKDALGLQEKRDFLLMSIDLIKTNDLLHGMSTSEREEISCYIQRVSSRLSTVELNVRTVRDTSQEDSLSQINMLIDMMITLGDPVLSRQRCQQYLNACSSSDGTNLGSFDEHGVRQDDMADKKFESALLGCTLDDQKNIKKRLQALMGYLNKQTIRD